MSEQVSWDLTGVKCSFEHPERVKAIWKCEALKLFRQNSIHRDDLLSQANDPKILRLTRDRLKHVAQMLDQHIVCLEHVLSCLHWREVDDYSFARYLNENPQSSSFMNEYSTFFRDWSWGDNENSKSLELIKKVFNKENSLDKTMVLGAGGGRLAYDLFRQFNCSHMTLVDINPFNMLLAKRVIGGEELELVEFPIIPKTTESFAVKQSLKAPEKITSNIDYLVADARSLNFEEESFDTIVTPWLMDVIQMDLSEFLKLINSHLKMGGRWINYGPIGFNRPKLANYYSYEEVLYLLEKNGFKVEAQEYELLPYMQSPHSNAHRKERVLCFSVVKEKSFEYIAPNIPDSNWDKIKDTALSFPIKELGLVEVYAFNQEIYELIDAKKTPEEIVKALSAKYSIQEEEMQGVLQNILFGIEQMMRRNPNA